MCALVSARGRRASTARRGTPALFARAPPVAPVSPLRAATAAAERTAHRQPARPRAVEGRKRASLSRRTRARTGGPRGLKERSRARERAARLRLALDAAEHVRGAVRAHARAPVGHGLASRGACVPRHAVIDLSFRFSQQSNYGTFQVSDSLTIDGSNDSHRSTVWLSRTFSIVPSSPDTSLNHSQNTDVEFSIETAVGRREGAALEIHARPRGWHRRRRRQRRRLR